MNEPVIQLNPNRYEPVLTKTAILFGQLTLLAPVLLVIATSRYVDSVDRIETLQMLVVFLLVVITLAVLVIIRVLSFSGIEANSFLRWRAIQIFTHRDDLVIDPKDPDCTFIEVVPRKNLLRLTGEEATDVGFVKVDIKRKMLLFEGGFERWSVASSDIVDCHYERHSSMLMPRYFIFLRMKHPEDNVAAIERLISPRYSKGFFFNRNRRQRTEKIIDDIYMIRHGEM